MKKIYLLTLLLGIFAFISCSDDDDKKEPEIQILPKKITSITFIEGNTTPNTKHFLYDKDGKMIKYDEATINYNGQKINVNSWDTTVLTLANNRMISAESLNRSDKYGTLSTFEFSGDYLLKTTEDDMIFQNGKWEKDGEVTTENYKWNNGKISEVAWLSVNYTDKYVYTYDKEIKNNANLDLFNYIGDIDSQASEGYMLNVAGKRNTHMPTACINTETGSKEDGTYNFRYEYTLTEGYITEIKVTDIDDDYTTTYKIEYED